MRSLFFSDLQTIAVDMLEAMTSMDTKADINSFIGKWYSPASPYPPFALPDTLHCGV